MKVSNEICKTTQALHMLYGNLFAEPTPHPCKQHIDVVWLLYEKGAFISD